MIIDKYHFFINRIMNHPWIQLDNAEKNKIELLENSSDIMEWQKEIFIDEYNVDLLEKDFIYFNFEETCISWECKVPEIVNVLTGGFKFNGITDALTMPSTFWKGAFSLPPGEEIPEELKKYENIGWYEKQVHADDGRRGCFLKEPGKFPPQMLFYNRGWYTPMKLSLEEYLITMFSMYAVKGWQFFYIDFTKNMPYWEDAIHDMDLAMETLPQIFPDDDWSYQIEKLKNTKKNLRI